MDFSPLVTFCGNSSAARIKILPSTCAVFACCAQHPLLLAVYFLTARCINSDASDIFPRQCTLRISWLTVLYCRQNGAKEAVLAKCVVGRLEGHNLCAESFGACARANYLVLLFILLALTIGSLVQNVTVINNKQPLQ